MRWNICCTHQCGKQSTVSVHSNWARFNEDKNDSNYTSELDWMEKYEFGSDRRPRTILVYYRNKPSIEHNVRVTKSGDGRWERRPASTAVQLWRSWAYLLCFGSIPRFSCSLGDRAVPNVAIATAMIFFWGATAGVRFTMVCTGWASQKRAKISRVEAR